MGKIFTALGLMSGTSGDGVDASIIRTNGTNQYETISDKYFEYDADIYKDIHNLKEKIHKAEHLEKFKNDNKLNPQEFDLSKYSESPKKDNLNLSMLIGIVSFDKILSFIGFEMK